MKRSQKLIIHVAQRGPSLFVFSKKLRTAERNFLKLLSDVSVDVKFTPSMGQPMAESKAGPNELVVGKDKGQLRMAHNNLEKVYRGHIKQRFPIKYWSIASEAKENMSQRGVDLKCTLDFYPFPRSFPEPLPETQSFVNKAKVMGDIRVGSKKKKKKNKRKTASVPFFSVSTDSTAFDEWRHLQDSQGTGLPVLQRENGGLQQTVMFWRDTHSCAQNPARMRQLLNTFRPDTVVFELTPTDPILLSRYSRTRIKHAMVELFTKYYVGPKAKRQSTEKKMREVELKWYRRLKSGFLHLHKVLRYCEKRQATTTFVAADWSGVYHHGIDVVDTFLDACHLLDNGSFEQTMDAFKNGTMKECDQSISSPHLVVTSAYRNDFNVLPLLEMVPTHESRHERVLAVYGANHVDEMSGRMTGRRTITKLVKIENGRVHFELPKAYNFDHFE